MGHIGVLGDSVPIFKCSSVHSDTYYGFLNFLYRHGGGLLPLLAVVAGNGMHPCLRIAGLLKISTTLSVIRVKIMRAGKVCSAIVKLS